jgi:hypothetical protein
VPRSSFCHLTIENALRLKDVFRFTTTPGERGLSP